MDQLTAMCLFILIAKKRSFKAVTSEMETFRAYGNL